MTKTGYRDLTDLKYRPKKTEVLTEYRVTPSKGFVFNDVINSIAGESSIGTWTHVSTMKKSVSKKLSPHIYSVNRKTGVIRIAYPLDLFEWNSVPEILSSIGGNIFGMKSIKGLLWKDITFPEKMLKSFKGPQFGIKGVRKRSGVKVRPLVGTIVKPKVGLSSSQHAEVAYESWKGGCDFVKDDENLTNQTFNRFKPRFLKTIKLLNKAEKETGEKKIYAINCTAETEEMLKRIKFVEENGGNYVMLDILTLGWSALQTARNHTHLPIHAHRAGHAAFDRSLEHGIKMNIIAKFARMIGVDTLHIGTAFGKMSGSEAEVLDIEKEIENNSIKEIYGNLRQEWYKTKPVLGVASGGVHPGLVKEIIGFMGNDVLLQAGGGIHGHPDGTSAGARAMRQAVDATLKKVSLKEYAKDHKELRRALEKWSK